jgi:hypothetical protein
MASLEDYIKEASVVEAMAKGGPKFREQFNEFTGNTGPGSYNYNDYTGTMRNETAAELRDLQGELAETNAFHWKEMQEPAVEDWWNDRVRIALERLLYSRARQQRDMGDSRYDPRLRFGNNKPGGFDSSFLLRSIMDDRLKKR